MFFGTTLYLPRPPSESPDRNGVRYPFPIKPGLAAYVWDCKRLRMSTIAGERSVW